MNYREQDLLNACIDYIRSIGGYACRINCGKFFKKDNTGRIIGSIKLAPKGTPDIFACIKGRFVAIEVKKDESRVRAWMKAVMKYKDKFTYPRCHETTLAQYQQMTQISNSGGKCVIVGSFKSLEKLLKNIQNE